MLVLAMTVEEAVAVLLQTLLDHVSFQVADQMPTDNVDVVLETVALDCRGDHWSLVIVGRSHLLRTVSDLT